MKRLIQTQTIKPVERIEAQPILSRLRRERFRGKPVIIKKAASQLQSNDGPKLFKGCNIHGAATAKIA